MITIWIDIISQIDVQIHNFSDKTLFNIATEVLVISNQTRSAIKFKVIHSVSITNHYIGGMHSSRNPFKSWSDKLCINVLNDVYIFNVSDFIELKLSSNVSFRNGAIGTKIQFYPGLLRVS